MERFRDTSGFAVAVGSGASGVRGSVVAVPAGRFCPDGASEYTVVDGGLGADAQGASIDSVNIASPYPAPTAASKMSARMEIVRNFVKTGPVERRACRQVELPGVKARYFRHYIENGNADRTYAVGRRLALRDCRAALAMTGSGAQVLSRIACCCGTIWAWKRLDSGFRRNDGII